MKANWNPNAGIIAEKIVRSAEIRQTEMLARKMVETGDFDSSHYKFRSVEHKTDLENGVRFDVVMVLDYLGGNK